MKILINSKSTILPFADSKEIISLSEFDKESDALQSSLNFFDMGNKSKIDLSLTDSMDFNNEIRFYLSGRRRRAYNHIGAYISRLDETVTIEIHNSNNLKNATIEFLDHLDSRFENIVINYVKDSDATLPEYQLSKDEIKIESLLIAGVSNWDDFVFLNKSVQEYLANGDPYTAEVILRTLLKYSTQPDLYNEMSLVKIMQGDFTSSELYLKEWKKRGTLIDKAYANYALSMLYARHYDGNMHSLFTAKELLIEAQNILENIRDIDNESLEADKQFMLNGYALILFRTGKINEAIEIEQNAIKKLSYATKGARLLQKSVLYYNLAQCYTKINKLDLAVETYKDLLAIDNNFPDYHIELAKVYLAKNDLDSAWEELKCAYKIDNSISELNSLMGYVQLSKKKFKEAVNYYKVAYQYEYLNPDALYDLIYSYTEQNDYESAYNFVKKFLNNQVEFLAKAKNEQIKVDLISITAEVLLNYDKVTEANKIIKKWNKIFNSDQLSENLRLLSK
ncbi:tetratricopeptide repeat protein [Lactobacillus helveticus]|uniref:tetratricopeptide repeat protein n=1 Tax=Lactobacillus helveticus TaxID=1587 RepID=UPI003862D3F5